MPFRSSISGDNPVVKSLITHSISIVAFPFSHVIPMRHNSRARSEFTKQLGTELQVHVRKQEKGDHGRFADISLKKVSLNKLNQAGHARFAGILIAFLDKHWVNVDAHTPS